MTDLSLTSLTMVLVMTSILLSLKVDSVYWISCLEKAGRTFGRASIRVIFSRSAISGYHFLRSSWDCQRWALFVKPTIKKSCNSPAYSTPVGPPPTTTMCINRSISDSGWSLKAAVSIPSCQHESCTTSLTIKELRPDLVGIAQFLKETRVFGDTLDTEGLVLTADGVDKVVVWQGDRSSLPTDIREI